jgi:23S rRNA pseudouridine1911/1915/1917 synthase
MNVRTFTVEQGEAGERIDIFLAAKTGITRSQIQKLIGAGNVLVKGINTSQNYRIRKGDLLSVSSSEAEADNLVPECLPLNILYEDDCVVVIDKPAGMVVYPASGHRNGTLMNALAYYCKKLADIGGPLRPGVVHRLDRDTSGVMVIALTDDAYYNLVEQFRNRTIKRKYIAIIYGNPEKDEGEISAKIGRSASDRKKMSARSKRGKEALTGWKVIKRFDDASLIEARLGTGRTHQIRVHLASTGHPVLGDKVYGGKTGIERKGAARKKISFPRQMLHAALLGFNHPANGVYMEFSSPLPDDMQAGIENLSANPRN